MKPSKAIAHMFDFCPETEERQVIVGITGSPLTIYTMGDSTAWRHSITTEEVDPSMIPILVQEPALN